MTSETRWRWSATSRKYVAVSAVIGMGVRIVGRVGVHGELPHRLAQRHHRAADLRDLALEDVDPDRVVGARRGRRPTPRPRRRPPPAPRRRVSYSSTTRSQMAYMTAHRAVLEHLGPLLEVVARVGEVDALAVPDGDDEVAADEHVDLAGLDRVLLVDVPERLEHEEQRVAVVLELGALVGVAGVLDGQRVQVEGVGDRAGARRGSGRGCRSTGSRPGRTAPARARGSGRRRCPGAPACPGGRGRCRRSRGSG